MARLIGKTDDGKDIYGVDFDIEVKECKQADDGKRTVSMIGSTPAIDRDGDTIKQTGWDLSAFKQNPVILFGHNHDIPAIGRANKFKKNKEALTFEEIEFPKKGIHPFADMIFSLMKAKFIKAGSVGFIPLEFQRRKVEEDEPEIGWFPTDFKKQELVEFSIVNVGSNRDALVTHLGAKGFKTTGKVKIDDQEFEVKQLIDAIFTEVKTVIPFKHYPLADEDTAWDGPKERREADVDQLKKMSTWFDSENPDVKSSYKLHHHLASNLTTVLRSVNAAMGALLGARGGVDIPDGDRRGTYNHLAKHIREYDREPPDFKDYSEAELKEIFPELFEEKEVDSNVVTGDGVIHEKDKIIPGDKDETEWQINIHMPQKDGTATIAVVGEKFLESCFKNEKFLEKAGAVLSRANKNKLKTAAQSINDVLAAAEPAPVDEGNSSDDKPKSPEEVDLKQIAKELAEHVVTAINKQFEQVPANVKTAEEIDLNKIKVPSDEINLEGMELPQEKEVDEVDVEMLSKVLVQLKQEQLKSIEKTIVQEVRKAAGIVD